MRTQNTLMKFTVIGVKNYMLMVLNDSLHTQKKNQAYEALVSLISCTKIDTLNYIVCLCMVIPTSLARVCRFE